MNVTLLEPTPELLQSIETRASLLFRRHGLIGWRLRWGRARTQIGMCRYETKEITLSRPLLNDMWHDTLLHEIAHALTPGHGHDRVWRVKCVEIGANPQPRSKRIRLPDSSYNYATICRSCNETIERTIRRCTALHKYRCIKCNGTLQQVKLNSKELTA